MGGNGREERVGMGNKEWEQGGSEMGCVGMAENEWIYECGRMGMGRMCRDGWEWGRGERVEVCKNERE